MIVSQQAAARLHEKSTNANIEVIRVSILKVHTDDRPPDVEVQLQNDNDNEQRNQADQIIQEFNWSIEAEQIWQANKDTNKVPEFLNATDPISQAIRVYLRAIQDCNNKRWRLIAENKSDQVTPVLEEEINNTVITYLQEGYSLPTR